MPPLIRKRKQRSKVMVIMLMPTLIVIALVGLVMYLSGNQYCRPSKVVRRGVNESRGDGVSFLTAAYEEQARVISK